MGDGASSTGAGTEPKRTTKATHPDLPPGLVLGADGKPCKVCNSWQDWAKIKVKKKPGDSTGASSSSTSSFKKFAASASGATAAAGAAGAAAPDRTDCPPDTAELGRATWTFLHTAAAYYPTKASPSQQTQMRNLLASLPTLYPCVPCAEDFGADMAQHAPDVSGRAGLSRWLCERHNEVNAKLGKTTFKCTEEKLDERWKTGPPDGRCD